MFCSSVLLGAVAGARVAVAVAVVAALAREHRRRVGGQSEVGRVARDRAGGVAAGRAVGASAGAAGVASPRDLGQLERPGEPPAGAGIVDDPLAGADRGCTGPRVVARAVAASGLTVFRCHLGTAGRSGLGGIGSGLLGGWVLALGAAGRLLALAAAARRAGRPGPAPALGASAWLFVRIGYLAAVGLLAAVRLLGVRVRRIRLVHWWLFGRWLFGRRLFSRWLFAAGGGSSSTGGSSAGGGSAGGGSSPPGSAGSTGSGTSTGGGASPSPVSGTTTSGTPGAPFVASALPSGPSDPPARRRAAITTKTVKAAPARAMNARALCRRGWKGATVVISADQTSRIRAIFERVVRSSMLGTGPCRRVGSASPFNSDSHRLSAPGIRFLKEALRQLPGPTSVATAARVVAPGRSLLVGLLLARPGSGRTCEGPPARMICRLLHRPEDRALYSSRDQELRPVDVAVL